jgi:hypothetical protein
MWKPHPEILDAPTAILLSQRTGLLSILAHERSPVFSEQRSRPG